MKEYGGFLPLEQTGAASASSLHAGGLALSTGRACLSMVLRHLRPRRVLLPYYLCESMVTTVIEHGIDISFYAINEKLVPAEDPVPSSDELLVVVNYFGIRGHYTRGIADRWGNRCLVDNAQAFFEEPCDGAWCCYSARKFIGVPDGAYLYSPSAISADEFPEAEPSASHLSERLMGDREKAYQSFIRHEASIDSVPRRVSAVSRAILSGLDYEQLRYRRIRNAERLHQHLGKWNILPQPVIEGAAPLCYPFLVRTEVDRQALAKELIFLPRYWQEVLTRNNDAVFSVERNLARHLLPLPVDQRYEEHEMDWLADRIISFIGLD